MAIQVGRIFGRIGRSAAPLLCAILMLSALACGGGDDEAATGSGDPAIGEELGSDAKERLDGVVAKGEIPDGYPADIPLPKDAEPGQAMVVPNHSGLVTFMTASSRDDIFSYFQKEMAAEGWSVQTEENDARAVVRGTKGKRKANVIISDTPEGTQFAVTFEGGV